MSIPLIKTDRCNLTLLQPNQALLMQTFYVENWRFLKPWEPTRGDEYYSLAGWQHILTRYNQSFEQGNTLNLAALNLANNEVIALCNFSGIVHGSVQACNLGYSIAEKYQGQGFMVELLKEAIPYAMKRYELHRVNANHMPHNERSAALLKQLGFEREGYARSYLKIDGKWQDHVLNAFIKED
ncbi:MAG: ribosomal protein S5-alanine N-acetyltransferase [Algicola sp.]|nr:ribosomal protein S5-alanine N-acetyltransferase [Algicola sp.]